MAFRKSLTLNCSAVLVALTTFTPSAHAQIDEIIVTSQKREQSIQDVPIAVTAIDSDYIESRNITNIKSLSSLAPNVKIENTPGNTTGAQISIRGGVTINPALTWEPTVGLYLNGSYIGKTQGSVFDVADIERVEVLRGPQGTLYGRNTLGGAINIITAKPTGEFDARLLAGVGNFNARNLRVSSNLGMIGPIKAKVTGSVEKRDGFVRGVSNPVPGVTLAGPLSTDEFENVDKRSLLIALSTDVTENFTLDYTFDYSEADQKPAFSQIINVSENNIFDPTFPGYVGGGPFGGQFFGFPLDQYVNEDRQFTGTTDGEVFERSEVIGHNFTATLDTGFGELKSITAYRQLTWDDSLDLDGSPLPLASTQRLSDYDSFSQELQLTGDSGRLNYVFGVYYFEDDGFTDNPQTFFGGASIFDSRAGFTTDARAVYGQLEYAITEALTLTGGLRYTEEEKTIDRANIAVAFAGLPPNTPFVPEGTTANETFSDLSPQVTLAYEAGENVNFYAKYARGFKSGGFNGEAGSVAETIRPYDAETIDSFEAGAKTRFWDNRAQLNISAFVNKHEDMQLSVFTAEGAAASDVRNAGRATIIGLELEGLLQASERLLLRANMGLLDPEYDEFIEFGMDVSDDRAFPHAPDLTFAAGFDWNIASGALGDLNLTGDVNHSSEYFTFPFALSPNSPQPALNTEAPARTIFDARLAWSGLPIAGQEVEIAVWAQNLTDEEYLANFIDFGPGFGGLTNGYFGPPRTYGLTLGVDF